MERRFGYGLDELARRFDRKVSWVSRRLALVEVLPEAIQHEVREGKILAQVALKFLVPVARQSVEDCQRMAAIFAHGCHLNRKIDDIIKEAGFQILELTTSYIPGPCPMTYTYQGIAQTIDEVKRDD